MKNFAPYLQRIALNQIDGWTVIWVDVRKDEQTGGGGQRADYSFLEIILLLEGRKDTFLLASRSQSVVIAPVKMLMLSTLTQLVER